MIWSRRQRNLAVLQALADGHEHAEWSVTNRTGLARGRASRALKDLERKGLVRRRPYDVPWMSETAWGITRAGLEEVHGVRIIR